MFVLTASTWPTRVKIAQHVEDEQNRSCLGHFPQCIAMAWVSKNIYVDLQLFRDQHMSSALNKNVDEGT
jgi:hypothetical protein